MSEIKKNGYGVASISYDSVEILKNFADRKKITYPLLSDPDSIDCEIADVAEWLSEILGEDDVH